MFAASKSGSVDAKDPQFNYVTMLLHGNGTNGAQNNTFVDSSTNNFTITRNGNTTQGTFTPYGSNWSNYFDGSSAVVNRSNNTALAMGTGDFTIEFWMNAPSTGAQVIYDTRLTTSSGTGGFDIYIDTGVIYAYGGATTNVSLVSGSYTANQWNHIAIVRSGSSTGNVKLYINGTLASTYGSADTSNYSLGYLAIGAFYNPSLASFYTGYLSNLRVVKGTAVYTGNFTPSTTPLTAITNTSLLTCQSNRFIDNSTNAFALTTSGSPSVQRFSPFSPTTAYSTSVIGGSGYFDGTGDYLSIPTGSSCAFGSGDFTVECWVYQKAAWGDHTSLLGNASGAGANNWVLGITLNGYIIFGSYNGGAYTGTIALKLNQWNHVAVTRSGGTEKMFVNGVLDRTYTDSLNYSSTANTQVGFVAAAGGYLNGYLSNARVVNGTAVYTSAFTPPTAPLTAITNTSLLLSYTNAGILDNAMMNDLETVGNAQISTSVKKYGTGSMYFDGNGDYLTAPSSVQYAFQSGDFTVEMWVYPSAVSSVQYLIDFRDPANTSSAGLQWFISATAKFGVYVGVTSVITASTSSLSASTWTHLALVKNGSTWKIYINGTADATTGTNSTTLTQGFMTIACSCNQRAATTTDKYGGYIDDLRISNFARYTSNFTAPTAAFPDKG